jgi:hypothetical protein
LERQPPLTWFDRSLPSHLSSANAEEGEWQTVINIMIIHMVHSNNVYASANMIVPVLRIPIRPRGDHDNRKDEKKKDEKHLGPW